MYSYKVINIIVSYLSDFFEYYYYKSDKFRKVYYNTTQYNQTKYTGRCNSIIYDPNKKHYNYFKKLYISVNPPSIGNSTHNSIITSELSKFTNLISLIIWNQDNVIIPNLYNLQRLEVVNYNKAILGRYPNLISFKIFNDDGASPDTKNFYCPKLKYASIDKLTISNIPTTITLLEIAGNITFDITIYPKLITLELNTISNFNLIKGIENIKKLRILHHNNNIYKILPNLEELYVYQDDYNPLEYHSMDLSCFPNIKYFHDETGDVKYNIKKLNLTRIYLPSDASHIRIKEISKYTQVYYDLYNIPYKQIKKWI